MKGEGEASPPKPINWRKVFVALSTRFGWTPREIGDLTFAQVSVYMTDGKVQGGRLEEARMLFAMEKQRRARELGV